MDAAIMEGRNLSAGAVAGLEDVANPITAAHRVLTHTPHVLIAGEGARRLAEHFDLEPAGPPTEESMTILRRALRRDSTPVRLYREMEPHETVGAVARDAEGRLAAGTSTGGIAEMLPGRVGDSPIVGSGLYADDESGAVSMTGVGEGILRGVVAKEICDGLRDGRSPRRAGRDSLRRLSSRIHATAGAIVLDRRGRFALVHSTPRLCAGYAVADRPPVSEDRFRRIV